jgi:hypothetical protein
MTLSTVANDTLLAGPSVKKEATDGDNAGAKADATTW